MEPNEPGFGSAAELQVWRRLRDSLRPGDALLSNVRFSDTQGDHEIDLIVALEGAGIAVIEVKGGRVEHNDTGWVQHGGTSKRIEPVDQARRSKYALRSYLDDCDEWGRRRVRFAHLVAFPYSTIPTGLAVPDCPRWMVLDKHDLADRPLDVVWEALTGMDTENPPATPADIEAMVSCVRPAVTEPASDSLRPSPFSGRRRRAWTVGLVVAGVVALVAVAVGILFARANTAQETVARSLSAASPKVSPDPRFGSCVEAKLHGYGHYQRGRDPEYEWYRDLDQDGTVCE